MECWIKCYEKCPLCGSIETEYNAFEVLTSCPPKYSFRCKCGHHWSGIFENYPNVTPVYALQKQNGSYGWICPICGAGVSPYQDYCPVCSHGKMILTPTVTCDSAGICPSDVTHITTQDSDFGSVKSYATVEEERKRKQDKNDKGK